MLLSQLEARHITIIAGFNHWEEEIFKRGGGGGHNREKTGGKSPVCQVFCQNVQPIKVTQTQSAASKEILKMAQRLSRLFMEDVKKRKRERPSRRQVLICD